MDPNHNKCFFQNPNPNNASNSRNHPYGFFYLSRKILQMYHTYFIHKISHLSKILEVHQICHQIHFSFHQIVTIKILQISPTLIFYHIIQLVHH